MSDRNFENSFVGRNGLVVPAVNLDPGDSSVYSVENFFYHLWEANGMPIPRQHNLHSVPYLNELVVPAAGSKPLVLIRSRNVPTDEEQQRIKALAGLSVNLETEITDTEDAVVGVEDHEILLPPTDGTLKWRSLLACQIYHKSTYRPRDADAIGSPEVLTPTVDLSDDQPSTHIPFTETQAVFIIGFKNALRKFIEIVSVTE